jgi:hypothetical protein
MNAIREWLVALAFCRIGIVPLVGLVLCVGFIAGLCVTAAMCQPRR